MAQHDFVLANGTGFIIRGDMNAALAALVTNSSGDAEPVATYPFQFWVDTSGPYPIVKFRNEANDGWIVIGRADLPNWGLQAVQASDDEPAEPISFSYWIDTTGSASILKLRNEANDDWIVIGRADLPNFGLLPLTGGTLSGGLDFSNTDFTYVPRGTTAQRPASPIAGMVRYNTTIGALEVYAAGSWQSLGANPSGALSMYNVGLTASVGAGALTVNITDAAGATPSVASPLKIAFRSATAASGTVVQRTATSALSIVVPTGATLGHANGVAGYLHAYALDNAGTLELALSSVLYDERELQSTTAISSSSDDSGLYSTTARTNVPIRYLGRLKSNQAAAGTWSTGITEISIAGSNAYFEPRTNRPVTSTATHSQSSPAPTKEVYYIPAPGVYVDVDPGLHEIQVKGVGYIIQTAADAAAGLVGHLGTSTTPGSGLIDDSFLIMDSRQSTTSGNTQIGLPFLHVTKDLYFSTPQRIYLNMFWSNSGGTPVVTAFGLQPIVSPPAPIPSLRIVAKRVGP